MPIVPEAISWPSVAGRRADAAPRLVRSGISAIATTAPTTPILAIALPSSTASSGPKMFLKPGAGLSRLKSGLSACGDGLEADLGDVREQPAPTQMPAIGRDRQPSVVQRDVQQRVEPARRW